ncbi:MAG: hypothetical protein PHR75_03320 [Sulfurovum sp.]|nr:hypothetical protein [Sulfurovum sp.]MDD3602493.1 hypothetical protein [Sulfurovum sp.]
MFEELENTLTKILEKLDNQETMLQMVLSSLTTSKQVASFLNVSQRTIELWVKNGTLVKDIHYYHNDKGRLVFIPDAILEYKKNPKKAAPKSTEKKDEKKKPHIVHPAAKKLISGLK